MTRTLGLSWEEETRTEVAQAELRGFKRSIRAVLEKRFGALPDQVLQRIESATDAERLQAGVVQALDIGGPDELDL